MPKDLVGNIVYWLQPCAIIDLTMGNGAWAVVALKQGLPYLGVALTEAHHEEVLARLKVEAGIAESRPDECNANFAYGAQLLFWEGKKCFWDAARRFPPCCPAWAWRARGAAALAPAPSAAPRRGRSTRHRQKIMMRMTRQKVLYHGLEQGRGLGRP